MGAFYSTKQNFTEVLGWAGKISYPEWMELKEDVKAAALFLNFYEPIMTAWNKVKSFYTLEEDGVSTMLQYLQKNVPIISKEPKKYTPNYIYRVAFNCLYCICHDLQGERLRYENEKSNIAQMGHGEEIDLFGFVPDKKTSNFDGMADVKKFWDTIEALGPKAVKVAYYIINDDYRLRKLSKNHKNYDVDPLRDIEVKVEELGDIIYQLREALEKYKSMYY